MELARSFLTDDLKAVVDDEGILGRGGFGNVRLCKDTNLGYVAVKCCIVVGSKNQILTCKECVERELNAVMRARHKNIIIVHGVTRWDSNLGIVMEYLPGGNLFDLMTYYTLSEIPYVARLRLCYDVGNGLACLHNLTETTRIVHGDLKPQNCLLTRNLCCKIADFGSAQISEYTGQFFELLAANSRIPHTFLYLAPEKARNLIARFTRNMDVYSYGLIVFFVLARSQQPIVNEVDFFADAQSRIASLPTAERKIATFLANIMKAALNMQPQERPAMSSVASNLYNHLSQFDPSVVSNCVTQILQTYPINVPSPDLLFKPLSQMPILMYAPQSSENEAEVHTDIQSELGDERSVQQPSMPGHSSSSLLDTNEMSSGVGFYTDFSNSNPVTEEIEIIVPTSSQASSSFQRGQHEDDMSETHPELVQDATTSNSPADQLYTSTSDLVVAHSSAQQQPQGNSGKDGWMKRFFWTTPRRRRITIAVAVVAILLVIAAVVIAETVILHITVPDRCDASELEYGFEYDGSCFFTFDGLMNVNHTQSVEWCEQHNAHLAEFTSRQQYDFVTTQLRNNSIPEGWEGAGFWIAGTYEDRRVTLPSNSTPYVQWRVGRPSSNSSYNKMALLVVRDPASRYSGMENWRPTFSAPPLCVH